MATAEDKAGARRIPNEVFNQGKLAVIDEIVAPDYVEHVVLGPGFPTGIAGLKQVVTVLRTAFPDFQYTIEDEIAEGDSVALRMTARGTHRGEFIGIPATGKQLNWSEIHICRMANGRLVEHWAIHDQLGM